MSRAQTSSTLISKLNINNRIETAKLYEPVTVEVLVKQHKLSKMWIITISINRIQNVTILLISFESFRFLCHRKSVPLQGRIPFSWITNVHFYIQFIFSTTLFSNICTITQEYRSDSSTQITRTSIERLLDAAFSWPTFDREK